MLQFAILQKQERLVAYILEEHRFLAPASRMMKEVDKRVRLASLPQDNVEDETATLRLALIHGTQDIF